MAKCLDVCFHNAEPKWQQSRARGLGANVNIIPITLQPRTSWVLCLKQYGGTLHIVTAMRSYQNCGKNSINISGRGTSADQKLNNLWRKHGGSATSRHQAADHKLVCLQRNLQKIYKSMNLCSDCGVGDGDVSSSLLLFTRFSSVATFTCSERRRGQQEEGDISGNSPARPSTITRRQHSN